MWTVSMELKDAYFHIPIHQIHRNYLAFWNEGREFSVEGTAVRLVDVTSKGTNKINISFTRFLGLKYFAKRDYNIMPIRHGS